MIDKIKIYAWNMPTEYDCIRWCIKLFLVIIVNIILVLFMRTIDSCFIDVIWFIVLIASVVWLLSNAFTDDKIHLLPKRGDILYDNSKDCAERDYDELVNHYGYKDKTCYYIILGIDKKRDKILVSTYDKDGNAKIKETDIYCFFKFHTFIPIGQNDEIKNSKTDYYDTYKKEQLDLHNPFKD